MPSCSRLSRSGLETSQQVAPPACRPSLTATRHDGTRNVQAGTERCSRPNQKIARKRRTECRHHSYPDPKTSPLHETGASPNDLVAVRIRADIARGTGEGGATGIQRQARTPPLAASGLRDSRAPV